MSLVAGQENQETNSCSSVNEELRQLLASYLEARPHMSLCAISKRCQVSEPTLRRIRKGQVKTLPMASTVLNFLSYIFSTSDLKLIFEKSPPLVGNYLKEVMPQGDDCDVEFDPELNQELNDNVKYLVFKRAATRIGVSEETILRLFGEYGVSCLNDFLSLGYLKKVDGRYFYSGKGSFSLDPKQFVEKFKSTASYLSINQDPSQGLLNPFHVNYSQSVSKEAYRAIAQINKKSLKKIREILTQDSSQGPIPLIFLSALDSLDSQPPYAEYS